MNTRRTLRLASVVSVMAALTAVVLSTPTIVSAAAEDAPVSSRPVSGFPSFADVVADVSPAVVNISVTMKAVARPTFGPEELPRGFRGSPFDEFFGQFFNGPGIPQQRGPSRALGSGFVIDSDGYVVTNNHVIDGADTITVTFEDGTTKDAVLIGQDPKTDLALLKVESSGSLAHVALGDADKMRVGDWVLAIGNPFGLGGTATVGIVSAKGRDISSGPYDDYLQIDAPINSGNSGGPIFDIDGNVVGVNTAIFSPNGGNVGIGFAIPVNQVQQVVTELKENGHVTRGWLGVQIQPLDEDIASSLGMDSDDGALVAEVLPDSPAEKAGIETGDVITEFDGKAIDSPKALSLKVASTDPAKKVRVTVWRDGREKTVSVRLGESNDTPTMAAAPGARSGHVYEELGMSLTSLNDTLRQQLDLDDDTQGLVVTDVEPGTAASEKGLRRGDVIRSVNGEPVKSLADMDGALRTAESDDKTALMLVKRGDGQRFVAFALS